MKLILFPFFLIIIGSPVYGDRFSGYNLYFTGSVKHFNTLNTASDVKEGNMELLALSKDYKKGNWMFETGFGTFIDSYHIRSYMFFSNVSLDRFTYNWFKPILSLGCTYKGKEHHSDKRKIICASLPRLRIGKHKGLFTNVTLIPKYKKLTNGFIGIEFGYKF